MGTDVIDENPPEKVKTGRPRGDYWATKGKPPAKKRGRPKKAAPTEVFEKGNHNHRVAPIVEHPISLPEVSNQNPTEPQRIAPGFSVLAGKWVRRAVDSKHVLYASFDAKNQFYTKKGEATGTHARIEMEDGSGQDVRDILEAKPQTVHIMFPQRSMDPNWLFPGKQK